MSFKIAFNHTENVAESIRRVLHEQCGKTIKSLDQEKVGDEEIHDARKRCKKMRSILRLARPGLKNGVYKTENKTLRETKNRLETLRDREVFRQTVDELKDDFDDVLTRNAFSHFQEHLDKLKAEAATDQELIIDEPQKALREITDFEKRIEEVVPKKVRFRDTCDGLQKIYKQGRKRMKKARKKPTDENLHDWRKRVKDLCYQMRMLRNLWPKQIKHYAKETKKLSDYLGDDHDLAELTAYVKATPDCCAGKEEQEALLALIAKKRHKLMRKTWPLAERIYAENPGDFIDRIADYHDARLQEAA